MSKIVNLGQALSIITLVSLSLGSTKAISATQTNLNLSQNGNEFLIAQRRCNQPFMMVMTPEGGPLQVRDRNDINAKAFGTIPNRSVVLLKKFDRSGDWANIVTDRGNGYEGWVWANYLTCGAD
ncbi:SH3 domain-containing protein [Floridanema evergladense]|uniref:SH3 domain-containing protein n=1 Tax=Floridaenema evergladense BLCC-F167 TaxID=3153639 RepID=A0ABV4WHC4_9CYAN